MLIDSLVETKSRSHNILLVDWSGGSMQSYQQAASNTRVVAAQVVRALNQLQVVVIILVVCSGSGGGGGGGSGGGSDGSSDGGSDSGSGNIRSMWWW